MAGPFPSPIATREPVQILIDKRGQLLQRPLVSFTPGLEPWGYVAWGGHIHEALNSGKLRPSVPPGYHTAINISLLWNLVVGARHGVPLPVVASISDRRRRSETAATENQGKAGQARYFRIILGHINRSFSFKIGKYSACPAFPAIPLPTGRKIWQVFVNFCPTGRNSADFPLDPGYQRASLLYGAPFPGGLAQQGQVEGSGHSTGD